MYIRYFSLMHVRGQENPITLTPISYSLRPKVANLMCGEQNSKGKLRLDGQS